MKIRADVDKKFIRRFLFISIGCFGFMLYGLYDGLVVYPKKLEKAIAFAEIRKQLVDGEITESEKTEKWNTLCKEKNWGYSEPETPENAQNKIYFQWFVFGTGLIMGAGFLVHYLRLLNSWVEADEETVTTSWGQNLRFENISSINKKKWAKKGLAKVAYDTENGDSQTMVFDDFKFHRESMGQIMRRAESHLTDDQIVDGERESDQVETDKKSSSDEEE